MVDCHLLLPFLSQNPKSCCLSRGVRMLAYCRMNYKSFTRLSLSFRRKRDYTPRERFLSTAFFYA